MASPRQKMVVIAQPNEHESRKKRHTLERTRANHLSKQLQMRLQYAKLKIEHGWQRQNLNEVENLYFHHSLRGAQRPPANTTAIVVVPAESQSQSHATPAPAPPSVPDRPAPSSDAPSASPPSDSPPPNPTASHTPAPCPPSALDFSDPAILARLVQLHALPPQPTLSCHPSSTTITPTSAAQPAPVSGFASAPHPQPGYTLPPGAAPLHSVASQPPIPIPSIPTTPGSASQPITSSALTYDSFWSTHAASTGATRALYRTHTGFTASATPGGNMAMLTPGGHAAVMTSEGVYVGGGTK